MVQNRAGFRVQCIRIVLTAVKVDAVTVPRRESPCYLVSTRHRWQRRYIRARLKSVYVLAGNSTTIVERWRPISISIFLVPRLSSQFGQIRGGLVIHHGPWP